MYCLNWGLLKYGPNTTKTKNLYMYVEMISKKCTLRQSEENEKNMKHSNRFQYEIGKYDKYKIYKYGILILYIDWSCVL